MSEQTDIEKLSNENQVLRARLANADVRQLALESQCQRMRDALYLCIIRLEKSNRPQADALDATEVYNAPLDLELLTTIRAGLERMTNMPQYDQDDQFRLREMAKQLLKSISPSPNPAK